MALWRGVDVPILTRVAFVTARCLSGAERPVGTFVAGAQGTDTVMVGLAWDGVVIGLVDLKARPYD